jgi:phosphate transport system substrate-binding protein
MAPSSLPSSSNSTRDIVVTLRISPKSLALLSAICAAAVVSFVLWHSSSRDRDNAVLAATNASAGIGNGAPGQTDARKPARRDPTEDNAESGNGEPNYADQGYSDPGYTDNRQASEIAAQSPRDEYAAESVPYADANPRIDDPQPEYLLPDDAPRRDRSSGGENDSPSKPAAPDAPARPHGGSVSLNGAGSTFINLILQHWSDDYHKLNPEVEINYQAIGSGGGIQQLKARTVDFAATDGPMTDEQLSQMYTRVLHVPAVIDGIVVIYNIPGVTAELNFTPEILSGIYLGKIRLWNDPLIMAANPGVALPDLQIVVVHRSDGSGPTYLFTEYLSKVSLEWRSTAGRGTSVNWPIGLGGKGSEGIAGMVSRAPGAIGYVQLQYALQLNLRFARVRNAAGRFVKADFASLTQAAASAPDIPADFRLSLTNAPGAQAYPIAGLSWILLPITPAEHDREHELLAFLDWMLDRGEPMATSLGYAPLPHALTQKVRQQLSHVQHGEAQSP